MEGNMIKSGPKITLIICVATALVVSGAGLAAATPANGATHAVTSQSASSQWSLRGNNSVDVAYDGSNYVYGVTFMQSGSSLSGTLNDPYYPTSGAVSGTVSGNSVRFTFNYPAGSVQGTRTYTGTINPSGAVSGTWTQTGSEVPANGTWTLASKAVPATSTPSPSPTCEAADHYTVVTQHAGVPNFPELFTEKVTLSWCADPGSQPQIFSSSQSPDVEESGFSLSGILLELYKTAGLTFGVTPATAPDPAIGNGSGSASATASGLSFNQTLNLGQDLVALIPAGLLARAGLRLLPFLRSGQLARLSTQLAAVWSAAVATIAAALAKNFGLPQWVGKLLADFGLGKLLDAVKGHAEQFAAQAATSLAGLGRHPTVSSVVSALESAIKTVASALTFTKELWGPRITVTVASGQRPSVNDRASYADLWINVQALHVTTTPAS
jgi:hypothetical protein